MGVTDDKEPPVGTGWLGLTPEQREWAKWTAVTVIGLILIAFIAVGVLSGHPDCSGGGRYCKREKPVTYQPAAPGAAEWKGWPGAPAVGALSPVIGARLTMESGVSYVTLAASPDGSRLLAADDGGLVREWRLGSGAATALSAPPTLTAPGNFFDAENLTIAISPDLSAVATASSSEVEVQQVTSGGILGDSSVSPGTSLRPQAFGFSPDGKWLAFGDGSGAVHLVNVATQAAYALQVVNKGTASAGVGGISSLAFSTDSGTLAVGSGFGEIDLYKVATRERLVTLHDPQDGAPSGISPSVTSLAFGERGALLAAGDDDGNVYLWDVAAHRVAGALPGSASRTITSTYRVTFSPDGGLLAASFSDGTVRVWSAATGARLAVLRGGDNLDDDPIAFGPGGNQLVNVDDSDRITEWNLRKARGKSLP